LHLYNIRVLRCILITQNFTNLFGKSLIEWYAYVELWFLGPGQEYQTNFSTNVLRQCLNHL
jgi:hypothetical protein